MKILDYIFLIVISIVRNQNFRKDIKSRRGLFFFLDKLFNLKGFFSDLPTKNGKVTILALLVGVTYIASSHLNDKQLRQMNFLQKNLEELRVESIFLRSEYEYMTSLSQVEKKAKNLGVYIPNHPPFVVSRQNGKRKKEHSN